MNDELTTSANPIGGVHICERCGKKLYWQDELPKCWCESLLERVVALEARMTRLDAVLPPFKAFSDEAYTKALKNKWMLDKKQVDSDSQPIAFDQRPPAPESQPAIDWEKVAKSRLTSLKWENLPDYWKHCEIEAAQAAVAEYLRQVEKRHQDNFTEIQQRFIISENPLVIDREKIKKAMQVNGETTEKLMAHLVLDRFHEESEKAARDAAVVKEGRDNKHEERKQQFIISTNPLVVDWDKANAVFSEPGESYTKAAAYSVVHDWNQEQLRNQVKEGAE